MRLSGCDIGGAADTGACPTGATPGAGLGIAATPGVTGGTCCCGITGIALWGRSADHGASPGA